MSAISDSRNGRPRWSRTASLICSAPPSSSLALAPRFVRWHSALKILLDEQFEMRLKLFFELGVLSPLPEHAGESQGQHSQPSHVMPLRFLAATELISDAIRSQLSVSIRSCFRPAAVSE